MSHPRAPECPGPEPGSRSPILFHSLAPAAPASRRGRAGTTALASAVTHFALMALVVVVPLLGEDVLPESLTTTFFAPPLRLDAAPPPPPPHPSGPRPTIRRIPRALETTRDGLVAPVVVPDEIRPEDSLDLGPLGGRGGGVHGGVPDGVVGAIVGGLPQLAAPPPPSLAPVRPGGDIRRPVKVRNVLPEYPDLAAQAGVQGTVILECTISIEGRVTEVRVLRGNPLLDAAAVAAVRQWVYTPTLLNGIRVPVVMTVTVDFTLRR